MSPYLDEFSPVTSETVEKQLRSIDTSKASGSDGISGLLLKRCATVLAPSLTRIFNTSIVTGTVPHLFKKATITPIHKSGDKSQAGNYRPISLLPIVSKILEKVVSTQFKEYLNEHNFLPSEQFAYRQGHSAEDAVTLHSCFTPGVWRNGGRELDFPLSSCCYAYGPLNAHGAAIFHKEMLGLTFFLGR